MSKAIWICSRKPIADNLQQELQAVCDFITPDNLSPTAPHISVGSHTAFAIMNPKTTVRIKDNNVMLGLINDNSDNWTKPKSSYPIGSFALFREDDAYCELVTDAVASRTIWYYKNEAFFIAATSQIAIVKFLKDFQFNEAVIPWMLSTGSLGPELSWDKRIQRVRPDASVILDKKEWSLSFNNSNEIKFENLKKDPKSAKESLMHELYQAIDTIHSEQNEWVLPISGGYDSRGILCMLKKASDSEIKTLTWGLKSSLDDPKNDAYIATKLTESLKVEHQYYLTDLSSEPIETVIDRFILNGEGRIDHVGGYLDGFQIWSQLNDLKVQGIIRGDEAFGWTEVSSNKTARMSVGLKLCTDYHNLKDYCSKTGIQQEIPKTFERRENETLEQWRDRLYQQFRLPNMLAALSDLKLSYVEQITPLLNKNILLEVRKHDDALRNDKGLFRKIVEELSPDIPFVSKSANASLSDFFQQKSVVNLMKKKINTHLEDGIVDKDFLLQVRDNLKTTKEAITVSHRFSFKAFLQSKLPPFIINLLKDNVSAAVKVDNNRLGFRILMIFKMHNLMQNAVKG